MAFDAFTKRRLQKILDHYVTQKRAELFEMEVVVRYTFRGNTVTLFQERPSFRPGTRVELPVAQFRLEDGKWKVYWKDSKEKWHWVDSIEPDESFEQQLAHVDADSFGTFWF